MTPCSGKQSLLCVLVLSENSIQAEFGPAKPTSFTTCQAADFESG